MNKKDRIAKWEKLIIELVDNYKGLKCVCYDATEAGCLQVDGALHETIWNCFEGMLSMMDCSGWLEWYIFENDCGKHEMAASATTVGELRVIKTPKDLARLIVIDEDRNN
tara:strand:- start:268 stop:597 length:330 start_codon:yes stop_codon:yes gene_type:complete